MKTNKYTTMDYKQLQDFIKELANSGATEVEVETKDIKIRVKTQIDETNTRTTQVLLSQPMPPNHQPQIQQFVQTSSPTPTQSDTTKKAETAQNVVYIKSPMVGTFYRKPAPEKPDFVKVGDTIRVGQVVCIIEAMKLFNEIEAEIVGKVVEILVEDATPVEYDQPLFAIEIK